MRARVAPVSPGRYTFQLTIGQGTHDKLQYAQALLSHRLPSGDLAQVLDRALDALIDRLEKQKLAATTRPQPRSRPSARARHIPAQVKRVVWQRDQGRCTFVSETGRRCAARKFLEFDHVDPVARGGEATVDGMRLRCRAHNQYEAERVFGAGFMSEKREEAQRRAAVREQTKAVLAGLRELGVCGEEARRAAEFAETLPEATLEDRMRAALKFICPKAARNGTAAGVSTGPHATAN